jgi:hypothetical protein
MDDDIAEVAYIEIPIRCPIDHNLERPILKRSLGELESAAHFLAALNANISHSDGRLFSTFAHVPALAAGNSRTLGTLRGGGLAGGGLAVPVRVQDALADVALQLGVAYLPVREIGKDHVEPAVNFL